MLARAREEFERICANRHVTGSVLEVGAVPAKSTLLCMNSLSHASERIGINLIGPTMFDGFPILQGNANDMSLFPDGRFDAVLCNATLEHDKYFWKTVAEIKRVAKSGGLIVIGTPGYGEHRAHSTYDRVVGRLRRSRAGRVFLSAESRWVQTANRFDLLRPLYWAALTYRIHDAPGDYYRFSAQTFREVILEDLDEVEVRTIMLPPIIIGAGIKRVPPVGRLPASGY